MPYGTGTYGSKVGRPPAQNKKPSLKDTLVKRETNKMPMMPKKKNV
jgi:hypothetical protein